MTTSTRRRTWPRCGPAPRWTTTTGGRGCGGSRRWIGEHEQAGRSVVVTCSALKRSYRDLLREGHPSVWFAHVTVDAELLRDRVANRTGHYMPPSLLDSQLAALQPLGDDEPGADISGAGSPDTVVEELLVTLASERGVRVESGDSSS